MGYNFEIPVGTSGNTFTATVETETYSCDMLEEYLSSPQIRFRYNCTYSGYSGPDPCYVNSDTISSLTPSSYGKVGLSIPQIQSHGIKAYSQPNDYANSYVLFTTVEYANSWGGDPHTQNTAEIPYAGFNWTYSQITAISQWTISTNIPIFATDSDLQDYLSTGQGIEKAVNYRVEYPEVVGDKYLSAKLNMLRRRIMKNAVAPIPYEDYFIYTIQDGNALVTGIRRDKWLEDFGNLDIYFPNTLEGCPVIIMAD